MGRISAFLCIEIINKSMDDNFYYTCALGRLDLEIVDTEKCAFL